MTDGNKMRYLREVNKQQEEVEPLPVDFMDDTEKLQVYNIIQSSQYYSIDYRVFRLRFTVVHAYVIKNNLNTINGSPRRYRQ